MAENPPYGIEFSYYLKENYPSKAAKRKEKEKEIEKAEGIVSVPEWEVLEAEKNELKPAIWLFITNDKGKVLRKLKAKNNKGFNRISWDLSTTSTATLTKKNMDSKQQGYTAGPGTYTAQLFKQLDGKYIALDQKITFKVKPLNKGSLTGSSPDAVIAHQIAIQNIRNKTNDLFSDLNDTKENVGLMLKAYEKAPSSKESLHLSLLQYRTEILDLAQKFGGSKVRSEVGAKKEYPTIRSYIWSAGGGATYGATAAHKKYLAYANKMYIDLETQLKTIQGNLTPLTKQLQEIGAPKIKD